MSPIEWEEKSDRTWAFITVILVNLGVCAVIALSVWVTKTMWPVFGLIMLMTTKKAVTSKEEIDGGK